MPTGSIVREAAFADEAGPAFFCWHHHDPAARQTDRVAVICPPIGSEYTRAHRSLRHLADRFAAAGVPALRFDWHGTGDSPGSDLDPDRLAAWTANVVAACERARRWSGRSRVCLVGVRLGGTIAALASEAVSPDTLVLWNAPLKGRGYVRELQAIAKLAARASDADDVLEAAGAMMTAQTAAAVREIDLTRVPIRSSRALVVTRDDLGGDGGLAAHLRGLAIATDEKALPGWNGMMADHQHTVVPVKALEAIVAWVNAEADPLPRPLSQGRGEPFEPLPGPLSQGRGEPFDPLARPLVQGSGEDGELLCRFGEDSHLFGIYTPARITADRPAVVLFNGGAVHHVGPNRLYVTLARSLSAMGFPCLRFDLEGIGDSVLRGEGRENHPYPPTAIEDARAALAYLRERHGLRRFVALGLCSGAHTAFHSALQLEGEIEEIVLINPYLFYWREGMSLDVVTRMADAQQYKRSMRDPARWMKLLRGDVNFSRLADVAMQYPRTVARACYGALCESFAPARAPRLARDLRRLFDRDRRVTVLVAEGDPGGEIILTEARVTAGRALREGRMRMETIPGGDHTFTQARTRRELVRRVAESLRPWRPRA